MMLKAEIHISNDLAVKGFERSLRAKAIRDISYFYATRLTFVWLALFFADAWINEAHLATWHLLILFAAWVAISAHGYFDWKKELANTKGWSFYAELDDIGVKTKSLDSSESFYEWDSYKSYTEYEDYLQIDGPGDSVSFLPKEPELISLIEFTKEKIPLKL